MKKRISQIIPFALALPMIGAGFNKLSGFIFPLPEELAAVLSNLGTTKWLLLLVGAAEVIGGILLLAPKFRALGAIVVFPISVGILLAHVFDLPSNQILVGIIVFGLNVYIINENKDKYLPMIK